MHADAPRLLGLPQATRTSTPSERLVRRGSVVYHTCLDAEAACVCAALYELACQRQPLLLSVSESSNA